MDVQVPVRGSYRSALQQAGTQEHKGVTLAKPRSKLFDTGPQGQLPRKLGNRQGKWREELTKAMFCCGTGLQNVFFPLKKLCLRQRHWKTELDCKTSTLGPVHLSGAGLVGSPGTQRQVHARAVEEPVARQSPTCSGTRLHRTPQQHREAREALLHPGSSSWCPWTPQVARNW